MSKEPEFFINNRKKLRQLLNVENKFSDLVVITGNSFMQASADRAFPFEQDSNFFYLTGITEPETALVIDDKNEYLIVPERSAVRIAFEGAIDTKKMAEVSGIDIIVTETDGWQRLQKALKKHKQVATLQAPEAYIAHYEMFTNPSRQRLVMRMQEQAAELQIHDVREPLTALRMIKSDYELEMIQAAITETTDLYKIIEKNQAQATHEHHLLAAITDLTVKKQLVNAYDPIIASGKNALTLHYVKNNAAIDKTGMLLLDIGLKYNGYAADITRTISYKPTKRQQAVYDATVAVQKYAISLLKPGVILKDYEEAVRQYMGEKLQEVGLITTISKETTRQFYPHATSHFLGLDVHDVGDYTRPLEPGMVLTVEPGIYIKAETISIRIEDDVVITKNGNTVLSDALPQNISSLTISL